MTRLLIAAVAVFAIIFSVPIVTYGFFQTYGGAAMPEGARPAVFLSGVAVSKAGTAIAFTGIYALARSAAADRWLHYSALWWLMFVMGEIGQALGSGYSWPNAVAGIVSESIYLPLAAFLLHRILR